MFELAGGMVRGRHGGKPADIFDRDQEWDDLVKFATSALPGLRIAVVYGRRRQGKSYLLRRLVEATGGLYHLATEQAEAISLRRFADSLATGQGLSPGAFGFGDWEIALRTATELMTARAAGLMTARAKTEPNRPGAGLLVIDEFPYLASQTPGLPSIVQALYDRVGPGGTSDDRVGPGGTSARTPLRLVLCGSAISVMSELLSGTKALRGRAALELRITPFRYRDTRAFWEIDKVGAAFRHHALIGGTPGYRELVADPSFPEQPAAQGRWLARNVLRPSMPLFAEANRVIHEDPRIRDTGTYSSILATIATGESSPTKIGGILGRPATSLLHQLGTLESAGFVERQQDLLLSRRPVVTIADPIARLHHLVIEPYLADLEAGRAEQIWHEVQHTVDSKIFGPHFETLAREWVTVHARAEAGLDVGVTGQTTVSCREHRTSHEVDLIALDRGARPRTAGASVAFLGEAKARGRLTGISELDRLDHIRTLLTAAGHDASHATLGLFSVAGFTAELVAAAERTAPRTLLGTLDDLYGR